LKKKEKSPQGGGGLINPRRGTERRKGGSRERIFFSPNPSKGRKKERSGRERKRNARLTGLFPTKERRNKQGKCYRVAREKGGFSSLFLAPRESMRLLVADEGIKAKTGFSRKGITMRGSRRLRMEV